MLGPAATPHRPPLLRQEGSALVETALSMAILLTFIFGVMEVGLMLYAYHFISDASRAATRYAIVRGSDQSGDCTAPGYANCIAQGGSNTGDIATYVKSDLTLPGINPGNMTVNSNWLMYSNSTSSWVSCGTTDSCKDAGNMVQVQVQYTFPFSVPFVPEQSFTMSSTSKMVIAY